MTDTPDLTLITLSAGPHPRREDGTDLAEAVAWWAGEPHGGRPQCMSPALAACARRLSRALPPDALQELRPLIPWLAGTAGDGLDERRGWLALDWLIRCWTPAWLAAAGLDAAARQLRIAGPVAGAPDAFAVRPLLQKHAQAAADRAWKRAGWHEIRDRGTHAAAVAAWDAWAAGREAGLAAWEAWAVVDLCEAAPWDAWAAGWDAWAAGWDAADATWRSQLRAARDGQQAAGRMQHAAAHVQASAAVLLVRMITGSAEPLVPGSTLPAWAGPLTAAEIRELEEILSRAVFDCARQDQDAAGTGLELAGLRFELAEAEAAAAAGAPGSRSLIERARRFADAVTPEELAEAAGAPGTGEQLYPFATGAAQQLIAQLLGPRGDKAAGGEEETPARQG
jgi:hypothetical protein